MTIAKTDTQSVHSMAFAFRSYSFGALAISP